MATVFMKWLEHNPKDYDRGIQLITLGRLHVIKERIASASGLDGKRVLEIGCGTGSLSIMLARQGAIVTGVDAAPAMLAVAQQKIAAANLEDQISLIFMDATLITERLPAGSFDLIVSTLVFSELPPEEQRFVLNACHKLLTPGGSLLIADEVIPQKPLKRFLFTLVRLPLVILTWLLTRTTTQTLQRFDETLSAAGYLITNKTEYLGGSLVLFELKPAGQEQPENLATRENKAAGGSAIPEKTVTSAGTDLVVKRLYRHTNLKTLLTDLWLLFFRIIPPYPKVAPGLYRVGSPTPDSPVLVTGNFDLTVRRLVGAIDGKVDVWLLIADSAGINVWCAAGGGYFTAEKVIAALKSSRVNEVSAHHALILPQLCANGVDGGRIRSETGWGVHWGPARAEDIPAYLAAKRKKTNSMRWVRFPIKARLEMVTVTMGFYALMILLPVLIFWRSYFWAIAASLFCLSYFYAIIHPRLPGRDGLFKSIPLALITLAGLFVYTGFINPLPTASLFHWAVGLTGLSVFVAAELQGMSPLMRGEQANWGYEAVIAVVLGLVYWLGPLAFGWG